MQNLILNKQTHTHFGREPSKFILCCLSPPFPYLRISDSSPDPPACGFQLLQSLQWQRSGRRAHNWQLNRHQFHPTGSLGLRFVLKSWGQHPIFSVLLPPVIQARVMNEGLVYKNLSKQSAISMSTNLPYLLKESAQGLEWYWAITTARVLPLTWRGTDCTSFSHVFPASPRGKTQSYVKFQTTGLCRQLKERDKGNRCCAKKSNSPLVMQQETYPLNLKTGGWQ